MATFEKITAEYAIFAQHSDYGYYVTEAFIKAPDSTLLLHRKCCYKEMPSSMEILEEAGRNHIESKRPYMPGQAYDPSVSSPVYHLFGQLCFHFGLDPIILHNLAYRELELTEAAWAKMQAFAEWQGVHIVSDWTEETIEAILDSLTGIECHALRGKVEEAITLAVKPLP